MTLRLVSLCKHADIEIDRPMVVVGRDTGCDARLGSFRVSRRHCCLARYPGEVVVRDLGSTNGTWINGQRIDAGRLRPGDLLTIAHARYRLEVVADNGLEPARPGVGDGREDSPGEPRSTIGLDVSPGPDDDRPRASTDPERTIW